MRTANGHRDFQPLTESTENSESSNILKWMKPCIQALKDRLKVNGESLLARVSSLVLASKSSPCVPIKLYRDLPRQRELLGDRTISITSFSLSPPWALANPELAEGERARDICPAARILRSSSTVASDYAIKSGPNNALVKKQVHR